MSGITEIVRAIAKLADSMKRLERAIEETDPENVPFHLADAREKRESAERIILGRNWSGDAQ